MMRLTVKTLAGDVHPVDIDGSGTVQQLKAKLAEETSTPTDEFSMFRIRGKKYLPVVETLVGAGIVDGDVLRMKRRADPKHRAVARINQIGVRPKRGGVARSIKYEIRAGTEDVLDGLAVVGQKQDVMVTGLAELAADMKVVKNVLMGEAAPRQADQSDKARIQQIRNHKHFGNAELTGLRESEDIRKAAGKRAASTQLRELAEVADGSVSLAVGDMTREQLKQDYQNKLKLVAARDKLAAKNEKELNKLLSQTANGPVARAKAAGPVKKRPSAKGRDTQLLLSQGATGSAASTDVDGSVATSADAKGRGKSIGYAGAKRHRS